MVHSQIVLQRLKTYNHHWLIKTPMPRFADECGLSINDVIAGLDELQSIDSLAYQNIKGELYALVYV